MRQRQAQQNSDGYDGGSVEGLSPAVRDYVVKGKRRFAELDFLRGICVILMVFDHFMFNVMEFFQKSAFGQFAIAYWESGFRLFWHWTVVVLFFALCGISCALSRSNLKRGVMCFLVGCLISWATYMLESTAMGKGFFIAFGVLHCLGISILLFALCDFAGEKLRKLLAKRAESSRGFAVVSEATRALPALVGAILLAVYFGCIFVRADGEFLIGVRYEGTLGYFPSVLLGYQTDAAFDGTKFYSADFFSVLPYACFLLIGSVIGQYVYRKRQRSLLPFLGYGVAKPVDFIGRHALIVYVLHQIILGGIFVLISLI